MSTKVKWDDALASFKKASRIIDRVGFERNIVNIRWALSQARAPFPDETILDEFGVSYHDMVKFLEGKLEKLKPAKDTIKLKSRESVKGMVIEDDEEDLGGDKAWEIISARSKEYAVKTERKKNRTISLESDKPIGIILAGDAHVGSVGVDYDRLNYISEVVNSRDYLYMIQIGDLIDSMIWNRVKHERWKTPLDIPSELSAAAHWLKGVADKCVGIVGGNHDVVSQKMTGWSHIDTALMMVKKNIPYAPHQLNLTINVNGQPYLMVLRHKVKGNSQYNTAHGVGKWFRWEGCLDADLIAAGHIHVSGYMELPLMGRMRHAVQLGAYKKVDEYADENGFYHHNLRTEMLAVLHPDRRCIEVFPSLEAGVRYLGTYYE